MRLSFDELVEVLRTVFPNHTDFNLDQKKDDIDDWDSINHLNLIIEIEEQFNVKFTRDEIQSLDSLLKLYNKINQ